MSVDYKEKEMLGSLFNGVELHLLKPIATTHLKNLWQLVFLKKRRELGASIAAAHSDMPDEVDGGTQMFQQERNQYCVDAKRKECDDKDDYDELSMVKKPKRIWTTELQQRFLQVVELLGPDGMKFPDPTRL